ncbi:MAG: hypothetical protein QOJ18_1033, partial [Microbacteriaceae bacterium]|nr:hypothetical protein [Microbacteriaceae bacterium]
MVCGTQSRGLLPCTNRDACNDVAL